MPDQTPSNSSQRTLAAPLKLIPTVKVIKSTELPHFSVLNVVDNSIFFDQNLAAAPLFGFRGISGLGLSARPSVTRSYPGNNAANSYGRFSGSALRFCAVLTISSGSLAFFQSHDVSSVRHGHFD